MNKIRIVNVKTGKISKVTESAIRQLKNGGLFKNFEIVKENLKIETPSTPKPAPVNVVVEEEIPAMTEPEQSIEEAPATGEFLDIEAGEESQEGEAPKKEKSKK